MIPTNVNPLYSGHLKKSEELYVKKDTLVVIHEDKGSMFTLDLKEIRCVFPISPDQVRIFWRAPKNIKKNQPLKEWNRYQKDFDLDLKKSFPDREQRGKALKTEAKRLTNIILDAIQKTHSINKPNMKGYLAMHTGEYLMSTYKGQCKFGTGEMFITNLGIYFVTFGEGLCLDLPLDILDSYDPKNKTVKIHYFEPQWQDGYEPSSKKNRKFEVRISSDTAETVCDSITKAFSDGGAKEMRILTEHTAEFGEFTPDQHHASYFTGKFGIFKNYDDYLSILAKRKWGVPPTREVGFNDAKVVFACLSTGMPLDAAGELTEKDKAFREETIRYSTRYDEFYKHYTPLRDDIMEIITKNLDDEETAKVKECHPNVVFDTIKELAEREIIVNTFKPQSLVDWIQLQKDINKKVITQKLNDFPNGCIIHRSSEIFSPWSVDEAQRIVADKDFHAIIEHIKSLEEEYSDIDQSINAALHFKTFEGDQREEIKLRARRVYEKWCKTNPLSEWTDASNREWVQDTINKLDEEKLELRRNHYDEEKTVIEELRDAEMESENTITRLERSIKPKGIAEKDIYVDAWHDEEKHRWFTTNPYFRITETEMSIMTPDACDQKFGYKAKVFTDDTVKLKHGYPAVYDEENKWWVLLSTISEDKITKEMVEDKKVHKTLRYEVVEPNITIGNDGGLAPSTEKEWDLYTRNNNIEGHLLPLNERIRRMLFTEIANYGVALTEEDKIQQVPIITV